MSQTERGQTVVEYSLMLVLVAALAIFVFTAFGGSISNLINRAAARVSQAAQTEPLPER